MEVLPFYYIFVFTIRLNTVIGSVIKITEVFIIIENAD